MKLLQTFKEHPAVQKLQGALREKLPVLTQRLKPLIDKIAPSLKKTETAKAAAPVRVFACDYGASKMLFLEVEMRPEGILVQTFRLVRRPKDAEQAVSAIRDAASAVPGCKIRLSLKGQSVIMRFIQLPKMGAEEMRSAIRFEAENYIPFKVDDVILDFSVLGEHKSEAGADMADVLLVAAKKEEVYPLVKDFQDADVPIEFIDVDILASINALHYFHSDLFAKSGLAFLDIGQDISSICVVGQGKPRFIRDLSFGSNDIVKRLRRKLGITSEDAESFMDGSKQMTPEARTVYAEACEAFCSDLKVTLDYHQAQSPDAGRVEMLFLGGGGDAELLKKVMHENLSIPVEEIVAGDRIQLGPGVDQELFEKSKRLLPVALGLCLRGQGG